MPILIKEISIFDFRLFKKLKNGYYARWSEKDGNMIVFKKGRPVDLESGEPYDPKEKLK